MNRVESVEEGFGLAALLGVSTSVFVDLTESVTGTEGFSLQVLASGDLVLVQLGEADGSKLELLRSAAMMVVMAAA